MGWAYALKGMYPEAIAALQDGLRKGGDSDAAAALGEAFRSSGFRGALKHALDQLLRGQEPRPDYPIAVLYAQLGQANEAIAALEKAYAAKSGGMVYIKSSPVFDPIRSDPRFQDLVRRMNFPQ